jgi:hypothetical protein
MTSSDNIYTLFFHQLLQLSHELFVVLGQLFLGHFLCGPSNDKAFLITSGWLGDDMEMDMVYHLFWELNKAMSRKRNKQTNLVCDTAVILKRGEYIVPEK